MWRSKLKGGALAVVGVGIGFNGALVTFAPHRIAHTYGITAQDVDVTVLVRHRGVLLLSVGLLLVVSGSRRELRPAAAALAVTSMTSFVFYAFTSDTNVQQRHIAWLDVGLMALLGAAVVIPGEVTTAAGATPQAEVGTRSD